MSRVSATLGTTTSIVAVLYFALSAGAILKLFARAQVLLNGRVGFDAPTRAPPPSARRRDVPNRGLNYAESLPSSPRHPSSLGPRVKPLRDVQVWFCVLVALMAFGRTVDATLTLLLTSQSFMYKRLYARNSLMVDMLEQPSGFFLLSACACQLHLWLDTIYHVAAWEARKPKVLTLVSTIVFGCISIGSACVLQSQMPSWPAINYVFIGFATLCACGYGHACQQAFRILLPLSDTLASHARHILFLSAIVTVLFFTRVIIEIPPLQSLIVTKVGKEDFWLYFQCALLLAECLPMSLLLAYLPHRRTR